MEHHPVSSSLISSIAHDGDILEVVFNSGQTYRYSGVTPEEFAALKDAKSIGRHFGTHIRGQYQHERIEEEKESSE